MIRASTVEVLGEIRRDGRDVQVELCEVDGRHFIRLRTRRWEGRNWTVGRTLALRSDEAAGVIDALKLALERTPEAPGGDRRRWIDQVRAKLRHHERSRGRPDWTAR